MELFTSAAPDTIYTLTNVQLLAGLPTIKIGNIARPQHQEL